MRKAMRSRTASSVYPRQLKVVVPEALLKAVKDAADRQMTSVNAFVRSCILAELQKEKHVSEDVRAD
jgi:hypothetical protein